MDQVSNWYEANLHPYIITLADLVINLTAHHPWISTLTYLGTATVIYYYASRPRNLPPGKFYLSIVTKYSLFVNYLSIVFCPILW